MSLSMVLLLLLLILPSALVVLVIALPPVRRRAQRSSGARRAALLAGGLVSWALTVETVMAMVTMITYSIAEFYFDTMLNTVPGVSRRNLGTYRLAVQVEIWARQYLPWGTNGEVCFHADKTVCRLADAVLKGETVNTLGPFLTLLTLGLPAAALVVAVTTLITRPPRAPRQ